MKKLFKKLTKNKGPVPYEARGFRSGFALLFAVTLSAIVLSIALGVANIALKEVKFGTSAKATNEAFYAADTGVECALFNDKSENPGFFDGASKIFCLNDYLTLDNFSSPWGFILTGLGEEGRSCAKVVVTKYLDPIDGVTIRTTINSKGYDVGQGYPSSCDPVLNSVEREVETNY